MSKQKILIVEDEKNITSFLTAVLVSGGYQVLDASTGNAAISLTASHVPDLMLLDLGLPDMDGMNVLRHIREWSDMPVIVVSAHQDEKDKVTALDSGANDYITKPFGNRELLARIRNAMRLVSRPNETESHVYDKLKIEYASRTVSIDGRRVHLTPIEYKIVSLLAKNAGKVLTHDSILKEIWGPYAGDSQILRVNMANIRRKLEPEPGDPKYIITEVGVGYKMSCYDE